MTWTSPAWKLVDAARGGLQAGGEHGSRESEAHGVGALDRLLERPITVEGGDRTEHLLAGQEGVVADVLEHGRRDQVGVRIGPLAARQHRAALLAAAGDSVEHALELGLVDDRTDLGLRIGGIAHLPLLDALEEAVAELLVDVVLNVDATGRGALLSR